MFFTRRRDGANRSASRWKREGRLLEARRRDAFAVQDFLTFASVVNAVKRDVCVEPKIKRSTVGVGEIGEVAVIFVVENRG